LKDTAVIKVFYLRWSPPQNQTMIRHRRRSPAILGYDVVALLQRTAIVGGFLCFALLFPVASTAHGADATPAGIWKTIDDNTGQAKGLIRISAVNGSYEGSIEKIFPKPGEDPNPKCDKCDGPRHNQPVLGMTILWGFTRQGSEYQGGEILDPESGRIYRARMKLVEDGKKLDVRGFIGISLFGRSQLWLREE
jgi:uncharacterized protein (DUF2147 family)